MEVFWTFKWGHQVKVTDVQGHEPGAGCGYDAVEQDFGCEHISCGGGHFAWVVDAISTNCEVSMIWFLKLAVGDVLAAFDGNVSFCDELYSVGAFDAATHALGKASEFIG